MTPSHAGSPTAGDAVGVAVVYAGDYVNKLSGQRIERECLAALDSGCSTLVISFRDTELVNSIGVSILIGVIDAAGQRGARVVFSRVSRHNARLFDLLGVTRHVTLAETEEALAASFSAGLAAPSPFAGH